MPATTQVLVAGGGPVGLATAVELARRGIGCLVIEPRATVSHARPRCKTVNVRSMEHLRRWGIAERLRERAPLPTPWSQDVVFCTSLCGWELSRFTGAFGLAPDGDRFPELGQQVPQFVLEELLRDVVAELPAARLVTGARVIAVTQTASGVHVTVADAAGNEAIVEAEYVVGCDGPRSTVRKAIGSAYDGEHALRPNFGMVFRAAGLWDRVRHGCAVQYWVVNESAPSLVGPLDRRDTWWMIAFGVDRETGERDALHLIDAAAGTAVPATVQSTDPWTARMQIVDRLRAGRVFLAGDAAHLNPPFGGHGLNTGLGDAVDLGWKLAATLDGWGGPALLDTYELERRPVHERIIAAATENMQVLATDLLADGLEEDSEAGRAARRRADSQIQATKRAEFHSLDLVLDGPRLPHVWLSPNRSLYDELGEGLTVLVLTTAARTDGAALADAARARRAPVRVVDLSDRDLSVRYGAGLLVVRPDQHVGWSGDGCAAHAGDLIDRLLWASDRTTFACCTSARD